MTLACRSHVAQLIRSMTDASDFPNSTFWDPDTVSGVGSWGDANDDYQITDGAFADDFLLSYPSPHKLRRRYAPTAPEKPGVLLSDTFTDENRVAMVNDFVGSFIGFQARFEGSSHGAVHRVVGGCVSLLNLLRFFPLTDSRRDLLGSCPSNAPPGCIPGPKWSPNGASLTSTHTSNSDVLIDPLFMMHHAVRGIRASSSIS
jgi:tyrosinase